MSKTSLDPLEASLARLLNARLRTVIQPPDLTPVQITVIYAFLGFGALYFSDVYLPRTIQDSAQLAQFQALKGGAEVALTAGIILVLTARSRRAIQARSARLEELRAERDILHRVFRHNLRHDLNLLYGHMDSIQEVASDTAVRAQCADIQDRLDGMEANQDKITTIERVLDPDSTIRRLDLAKAIRNDDRLQELRDDDAVSVTLDLPAELPIISSPFVISAFHEILDNAIEHNDTDQPAMSISLEENADHLVDLVVTDNGPGIPSYERLAIERMGEDSLTHSSGLGLWLAKLACKVSGGSLSIPADQASGGRVVLELPEAPERTIRRQVPAITG